MGRARMLLLGAGFSKNWGGPLAKDVWANLFTNTAVQARERVRKAFLNERSFEAVMEDVLTVPDYDLEDRKAIIESVTSTFQRMDDLFIQKMINAKDKEINYGTPKVFMSLFAGHYMFTLNQDTLVERLLQRMPTPYTFATPYVQQFDVAKIPDEQPRSPLQTAFISNNNPRQASWVSHLDKQSGSPVNGAGTK